MDPGIFLFFLIPVFSHSSSTSATMRELYGAIGRHNGTNKNCSEKLKHMVDNFLTDPNFFSSLLYSGKGLNDLGNYKYCIADPANRYILMQLNGFFAPLAIGICGPAECRQEDYGVLKPTIIEIVNWLIANASKTIKLEFKASQLDFVDSVQREKDFVFFSPLAIAAFSFIGIVIVVNIIATVYKAPEDPNGTVSTKMKVLKCFDIRKNWSAILSTNSNEPDLKVLNGLRVFSMAWVILGHTFFHTKNGFATNFFDVADFIKDIDYSHILSAPYSVDIFFFMGSFLAVYITIAIAKDKKWVNPLMVYLHRIIRMMPLFFVTLLIFCYVMPLLGGGPAFYNYYNKVDVDCKNYWYYTLTFINNFTSVSNDCISHTWYISIDTQFYLLVPLVAILYCRKRVATLLLVLGLFVASSAGILALALHYQLTPIYLKLPTGDMMKNYFEMYYNVPHTRINPYLLGMLAGFTYYEYKTGENTLLAKYAKALQSSRVLRYITYVVCLAITVVLMLATYYFNKYPLDIPRSVEILYLIFSRPLFVLCTFGIFFPAMLGRGRVQNLLCSGSAFIPLGRLTYGAYLLHPCVMIMHNLSEQRGSYFEFSSLMLQFFGYLAVSFGASLVVTGLFESPVVCLDKVFLRPKMKPKKVAIEEEGTSLIANKYNGTLN